MLITLNRLTRVNLVVRCRVANSLSTLSQAVAKHGQSLASRRNSTLHRQVVPENTNEAVWIN